MGHGALGIGHGALGIGHGALGMGHGALGTTERLNSLIPLLTIQRYLENLSLNLSPTRRETLNFPPSRVGKGARGLGLSQAFPHDLNCQIPLIPHSPFPRMFFNLHLDWPLATMS
jgi:hypothetical protein